MRPQLELFAPTPMKVEPAVAGPRLWVRRFVIQSEPGVVLRDIPLRKGLNIVWSPDPSDAVAAEAVAALGHGAGKTLFCRLLRYCLGEDRFAPDGQRDDIASAFRDGLVGAEVLVAGRTWAVTRSIGHRRRHVALPDADLDSLMSGDAPSTGMDEFVREIGDEIVSAPIGDLIPGTRLDRPWLTALAWLTRDQECRFGDVLDWRAASSDSESPVRALSRGDVLLAMRALLGAMSPAEPGVRTRLLQVEEQLQAAEEEAKHRRWEAARIRREVSAALDLREEVLPPGRLAIEGLRLDARRRIGGAQGLPANDTDGHDLATLRLKLDDARARVASIESKLAAIQARLPVTREQLARVKGELPAASAATDEAENPVCPICEVPIDRALAEHCKLSHKLHDVETMRRRYERLQGEARTHEQQIARDAKEENSLTRMLDAERPRVSELKTRIETVERARDARDDVWATAVRVLNDVQRLDTAFVEQEHATNLAAGLREQIELLRESLANLRDAQGEAFKRLDGHFREVVRRLVAADADAGVKLTGRGLELGIRMGGNRSTAAIESLKVIAFDLATVILAIEGHGHLPAFLIHDSPREADLGLSSYHQVFALARSLEALGAEPPFQYIVTTTTRPPDDVRCEPWLRATLRGGPASERLLRRDL